MLLDEFYYHPATLDKDLNKCKKKVRILLMNDLLESAIKYAERGWYVFPTRPVPSKPFLTKRGKEKILPAKSPYFRGGFQNATTDILQIKEWWKQYPNAAIACSCGHSNLVVVDIDVKQGRNGLENWLKLNIPDVGALHASTPSGGTHIIYSGLTNSYANIKTAVDLRSQGAYFLLPPSWILKDGNKKKYIALDDWSRTPMCIPDMMINKLDSLREKDKTEYKRSEFVSTDSIDKIAVRIQKALAKLPLEYCQEYWKWVNVGLAIKSALDNEVGFELWNAWSMQDKERYDLEELEYRWSEFKPKNITIGSLFYWAYKQESTNS